MINAELTLYTYWRSSAAYRARIALNVKGLSYTQISINLAPGSTAQTSPEFLAVNPQGFVPALAVGDDVLAESLAIIEYLDEIHPEPALLPKEPMARARVRWMAQAIACDIHPLNNARVLAYLRTTLSRDKDQVNAWAGHWITEGFRALEVLARKHSAGGRFLYGDSLSLADVCLVPQVYNARRVSVSLEPYPTIAAIAAFLEALPPFAAARPELQPDAPR